MSELGILLDARSVHPGLSARSNLLALARTAGIGRRRVDEVIELGGLAEVAGTRAGGFSLGMGQRLGVAAALLGQPQTVVLDEPVNGLDPDGVRWIRLLLKSLAAEGHTVFVSSHLMSEMAQTATQLVVLGRGKLISQSSVEDFTGQATTAGVLVRTPETVRLGQLLAAPGITVINDGTDLMRVCGTTAEQIGAAAWRAHLPVYELTPTHASLEEAFMQVTKGQHRVPRRSDAMTAVTRPGLAPARAPAPAPMTPAPATVAGPVTQVRVVRAEWTKLRALRSTWWCALISVVLIVGLGAAIAGSGAPYHVSAGNTAAGGVTVSLVGVLFAQLVLGMLGVLAFSGEYATGMIRATLAVVPSRLPVLWAKLIVLVALMLPLSLLAGMAEFFVAAAVESSRGGSTLSLTEPGVLREVVGASLYLTVIAVSGLALGALLRRTAAGLAVFAAVFLVVPLVVAHLPASITGFAPYLPSNAGGTIWGAGKLFGGQQLSPWTGFAVLCGYAVVLTALAAWRLRRRDA